MDGLIYYRGRRLRPLNGHKCDEMGTVIVLADGRWLLDFMADLHEGDIVGASVCCSICGGGAFKLPDDIICATWKSD